MATQISQLVVRQDTASNWIDGGWLDRGELGFDTTYHVLKIGTADRQSWDDALVINDNVTLESLGITATAEEINILDGVVISSTILNYLDGVRSNVQEQIDSKSNNTHTHEYSRVSDMEDAGVHVHSVDVPTQTFENDGFGGFVLTFGIQTVNVSETGAHKHNLISETISTSAPNEK